MHASRKGSLDGRMLQRLGMVILHADIGIIGPIVPSARTRRNLQTSKMLEVG